MNEYIIYTTEGYTIAPNESVKVENCQILGFANGSNIDEAKKNLLNNNPWIAKAGFNEAEFIFKQVIEDRGYHDA